MKKLFLIAIILIAAVAGWSATTITLMNNGLVKFPDGEEKVRGYPGYFEMIIGEFEKAHPGVKVNMVIRDVSKGSLTFDAMLAAGNPPDVWLDAGSYHVKYMTAEYALPLEKYINFKDFSPDFLKMWQANGHQYAVPLANIATGMAVNLDMLKKIGYELPPQEKWTTDEFLVLAAKLKAAGIPATIIQCKGGMNTWTNVWLRSFGAQMFKPGDWSKVAINSPEAIKGLEYIKKLIDNEYTPNPIEVNDDDAVELFTTEKIFSSMMQNGHTDGTIPEQIKQGKIEKEFAMTFIEFPHAPNLKHTPVSGYQTTVLAHKNKSEATNKLIADLVARLTGYQAQWYWAISTGGFPTLKDFRPSVGMASKPSYKAVATLSATAGVYQEYPYGEKGTEVRRIWYTLSEQWVRGKLTPQAFLAQFETEANKVLAGK